MNVKSLLAKPFASHIYKKIQKESAVAVENQLSIFKSLIQQAQKTQFGIDHHFNNITNYEDYKQAVPIRDYELLKSYIEQIKAGKQNVLWKGKPLYFAKTSGTTSGVKYIPITNDSIGNHINSARNALLCYIAETGKAQFVNGKMIFLSGSPVLDRVANIPTGRLIGIFNNQVPAYLSTNKLTSFENKNNSRTD
ncbi:MAG: GH3 family domain-containing protein [Chitinophagaceae bacterium]